MTREEQERNEFADLLAGFEKKLRAEVPGITQLEVAMALGFALWKLTKDPQ